MHVCVNASHIKRLHLSRTQGYSLHVPSYSSLMRPCAISLLVFFFVCLFAPLHVCSALGLLQRQLHELQRNISQRQWCDSLLYARSIQKEEEKRKKKRKERETLRTFLLYGTLLSPELKRTTSASRHGTCPFLLCRIPNCTKNQNQKLKTKNKAGTSERLLNFRSFSSTICDRSVSQCVGLDTEQDVVSLERRIGQDNELVGTQSEEGGLSRGVTRDSSFLFALSFSVV
jgi:hypothetical protein